MLSTMHAPRSRATTRTTLTASALLGAVLVAACGANPPSSTGSATDVGAGASSSATSQAPATARVEIPGQDRFAPFVTTVSSNGTITVHNADTDEHTVSSLPGAAVTFDLHVKAGETKTLTLPAGTYRYYCTIHAKYVAATDQVAALSTSGFPDQPMEGVFSVG